MAADVSRRKGFRSGFRVDIYGFHQLLVSSHLRERDKMLLRVHSFWTGLEWLFAEDIHCRFCNAPDNDGHLFWDCTFPPFVELRNKPEFLPLMNRDGTHWPRCLLWHGWLPGLTSRTIGTPWAVASSDLASHNLDQDDAQDMVDDVPHFDVEVAEAGAFVHTPAIIFDSNHWSYAQDLGDPQEGSSHIFSGVLGPIQSVQRAEYWGVILALQAYSGIHIGKHKLKVLRGVAALLSQEVPRTPLLLVKDGDLLATIHSMLCLRGMDKVHVSKVKGHATQAMVDNGDVRIEDLVGNKGADTAADLGRLRQQDDVITARRDFLRVRRYWYPIIPDLHKFMVAVSRIEVNHDGYGGTAPDAMVWDRGGLVKPRASSLRIIVDHATLPGPPGFFGQHLVYLVFSPHHSGRCRCLALQCQHPP